MVDKKEQYSYSKLECLENCGYAFYLKYVLKYYFFNNTVATEFGTLLHETEETMFNDIKNGTAIDYTRLKNNFLVKCSELEMKYPEFNQKKKTGKTYKEEMFNYLDRGIYRLKEFADNNPNIEFVAAEQEFNFPYKNINFKGFIDRVFRYRDTGKYLVQDIKSYDTAETTKAGGSNSKINLSLQGVIYMLATKYLYNAEPEECTFQYDLPLINLTQDVNMNNVIARGKAKLDLLFNQVENKDFRAIPSPLCAFCAYSMTNRNAPEDGKGLCPYFSHWTREHRTFSVENRWEGLEKDLSIYKLFKKMYNIQVTRRDEQHE